MSSTGSLPEFFVSTSAMSSKLNRARLRGEVRRVAGSLHTRETRTPLEALVPTRLPQIIAATHPGAVISARSASLNGSPAQDGSVFLTHPGRAELELPGGIVLRSRPGPPHTEADIPRVPGAVWISSDARQFLEHLEVTRGRGRRVARSFGQVELEEWLDRRAATLGDGYLNRLRDSAVELAPLLGMADRLPQVREIIGAFLGTVSREGASPSLRARQRGRPYDHARVELFDALRDHLVSRAPQIVPLPPQERRRVLPFVDAYFSNYIEGTEFAFGEAAEIVFQGTIPAARPADAHDITGTYSVLNGFVSDAQRPASPEHLQILLRARHKAIMAGRPEKGPGEYKSRENRFGVHHFVHPTRVTGTLDEGYARYAELTDPFARAVFMMFMISEVHPFDDGNGRTARAMMNAELWAAAQSPVIIPTVFRSDYLKALRAMSLHGSPDGLIAVLDFGRRYAAALDCSDVQTAEKELLATSALEPPDQPGISVKIPTMSPSERPETPAET